MSPTSPSTPSTSNPRGSTLHTRHLSDGDWEEVVDLEFRTYDPAGLSEGRAALQARVRASPATCFVLRLDGRFAGYVLALPYPESAAPELADTEASTCASGNLHLHDLVIEHALRGRGLGRHLLHHVTATAAAVGFERISLVAVGGSDRFWARNGFAARPEVLTSPGYGADALYMSAPVRAGTGVPAAVTTAVTADVPLTDALRPRGPSTHRQKG